MKHCIYSERTDLLEPNIYIQFLVQITGNPDLDELVSAIKTVFSANEATMSRIVYDKNGDAYYERMPESGCKVSILKGDWKNIIRENEKVTFAIDQGELMRVFVNVAEEDIFLLIMAHHLAGDGKAVTYFIEDVMTALSGGQLGYKPMQLISNKSMPEKSELPLLLKLYVYILNKKWKYTGNTFHWDDYYKIHEVYWKERSSEIVFERFSPEEINRIHAYAKKIGVSVNSYIATAFLEADRNNETIGMAVNIRMDKNKSISNQATGISVDHLFSDKITFDENAQIVHKRVLYKLRKPVMKYFILRFIPLFTPSLIDSVLLYTYGLYENRTTQKLARLMGYAGGKTRELGITNLTKLDIPNTYGIYGLKNGLFIPPVVSYAKHIIGVSTMEDGMAVSYHFMNDQDREKELEFFRRAVRNLKM
ncbi:condensation domain-containing protein [Kineothrix alysoides]|uniref:Condensation domain-containing protein n=1 Tax=Kineothrix alysoides TaxID=1469948 RepID=A0A4R1QNB7_9FIRM|nr:hypothetical protein [Kineothrix alysoides]TCL55216.1 condensation domain-containing protein [Kineothrix alysoides]